MNEQEKLAHNRSERDKTGDRQRHQQQAAPPYRRDRSRERNYYHEQNHSVTSDDNRGGWEWRRNDSADRSGSRNHPSHYSGSRIRGDNEQHSHSYRGGGVDLQQYTRSYNQRGYHEWETVSDRQRRTQNEHSHRGDSSWQRQEEQPRPPPPPHSRSTPCMIVLAGIPGCGKSTFAKSLESVAPHYYVRINQDTLGSRKKCQEAARRALSQHKCPVIDRCNFDATQRRHFMDIAREYNVAVHCISLELPMQECVQRCEARPNHETIPKGQERQVVNRMMSNFQVPHRHEGFQSVRRVSSVEQVNDLLAEYTRR